MSETGIKPNPEAGDGEESLSPLKTIRTETVLSKLPIHNLGKQGSHSIKIVRQNDKGDIDLLWKVTPNPAYGEPRELAYKLDTIVINRRLEEQGTPLPEFVRIGSLRSIAEELKMGGDTSNVKKALSQNAHTVLTAEFTYTDKNGGQQRAEFQTTRYGLIFTGEKLPNGRKADAVYLTLNPPYRHILNNAVFRPLDYDYLKQLPPSAQRFYELISYRIFAALKNNRAEARLAYSDLCTFAPIQRYFDYTHFKKQVYKIHHPHLRSKYIAAARFEPTTDPYGQPDWEMFYTPGSKARLEYETFTGKRSRAVGTTGEQSAETLAGDRGGQGPIPSPNVSGSTTNVNPDPPLLAELMKRGIVRDQAVKLLKNAAADQDILDQLEYADAEMNRPDSGIRGVGFIVYVIKNNVPVPHDFETSRKRKLREDAEKSKDGEAGERVDLELAYQEYQRQEIDRYIKATYDAEQYDQQIARKKENLLTENRKLFSNWSERSLTSFAERRLRADLSQFVPFTNFETFCKEQNGVPQQPNVPDDDGAGPANFAV